MWIPDVEELINDDQAMGAAMYDELEDNDFYMVQASADEDGGRGQVHADDGEDEERGGNGHDGGARVGEGADGAGAEDGGEWGEMMRGCSEESEHAGPGPNGGGSDTAKEVVGVGKARERAGPGKQRRVATLARWEPSARAHMLACLESATPLM